MVNKLARDTNVCVIGAGVCGIAAVKVCLEAGFKVECYDKSPYYGGLWRYHDHERRPLEANDGFIPSVMRTTILNTSKELSSFSDFPPNETLPNYMKHSLYMDYINNYVENFKLLPHIHLKNEILNCELKLKSSSSSSSSASADNNHNNLQQNSLNQNQNQNLIDLEWQIKIKNLITNEIEIKKFDKLMIATGHHNRPNMPTFKDQQLFKGELIHSGIVKDVLNDKRFIDKRVLVVGFGNSACDIANDISQVSEKCYLSSHRGNWIWSRLTPNGIGEFEYRSRFNHYSKKYLPKSLIDKLLIKRTKSRVNHKLLGLTPKHTPMEHIPAINDLFPYRIITGGITIKSSIKRFTENGVVFDGEYETDGDEELETKIDIVVFATGYTVKLNFFDEFKYGLKSANYFDDYELFMNVFAPKLKIQLDDDDDSSNMKYQDDENFLNNLSSRAIKSLAMIGFAQAPGSMTVLAELQARWATLVFDNKLQLPSVKKMLKYNEQIRKERSNVIRSHQRDQLVGDYMSYLDKIAKFIGVKPNLTKLFIKDFFLWKQLMFGPSVSYQYRLNGPGEWEKARQTIMNVNRRVYMGINDGKNDVLFKVRKRCLGEQQPPSMTKNK